MSNHVHVGPVMPETEEREFAYENELVCHPIAVIVAHPNYRRGAKPTSDEENTEREKYSEYTLVISRGTGSSLDITLRKKRKDIVPQRVENGAAVEEDIYTTSMSFAEMANRLLADRCMHFEDKEGFPDSIRSAMRTAYQR